MTHLLVVEDNDGFAYGLVNNLVYEGYDVVRASTGEDALEHLGTDEFALVILDLMLPGLDGYRVLKALRQSGNDMPVLILSARGEEMDKVRGFRFGADDYVTKPCGIMELIARVEALLRRARPVPAAPTDGTIRFGAVEVDTQRRVVSRNGHVIELAPLEFDLLVALAHRQGAAVSRLDLLREVWGHTGVVLTRTVDTHVSQIRRKLEEDPARPRHVLTVRKVGYRLQL